jgi:CBS domain-containing protein
MFEHRYGSAVVLEDGHVIGVFTTTDALRALTDALEAKG